MAQTEKYVKDIEDWLKELGKKSALSITERQEIEREKEYWQMELGISKAMVENQKRVVKLEKGEVAGKEQK